MEDRIFKVAIRHDMMDKTGQELVPSQTIRWRLDRPQTPLHRKSPPSNSFVESRTRSHNGVLILTLTTEIPAEQLNAIANFVAIIIDGSRIEDPEDFDFRIPEDSSVLLEVLRIFVPRLTVPQLFALSTLAPSYSNDPEIAEAYLRATLNIMSLPYWKNQLH